MKKVIGIICSICLCLLTIQSIHANEYYYEETIDIVDVVQNTRAISTKTAKKTSAYKDSNGNTLWSVTVTGTFTYNGSTSSCTNSSVSTSVNNANWKIVSTSASKSGNTAKASATANHMKNGYSSSTIKKDVTLKCSANGSLS